MNSTSYLSILIIVIKATIEPLRMKGIVFNQLQEFVEIHHGVMAWDQAILSCGLPSEGVYVSTKSYQDSELLTLVGYFSDALKTPAADITRAFGDFVFDRLITFAADEAKNAKSLRDFLLMVEDIIHDEVSKLYHDANVPSFGYQNNEESLVMIYRSPRKLCYFSEGLIYGAAQYFNETVVVSQSQCMHDGADSCHLVIEFK